MPFGKIQRRDLDTTINQLLDNVGTGGGGTLRMYTYSLVAETDNQTEFVIPMETFDVNTDTVLVQNGMLMMFPGEDFTVEDKTVKLVEGVHAECTIGVYVLKNVETTDEETMISGSMIIDGTIPLSKLAEQVDVSGQITAHNQDATAHTDNFYTKEEVDAKMANNTIITSGTEDLEAGVSELAKNTVYLVYE